MLALITALAFASPAVVIPSVTLQPKIVYEPTLRYSLDGIHSIENPKPYPVIVTLSCGADYEPILLPVGAHVTTKYNIRTPEGTGASCILDAWKRSK